MIKNDKLSRKALYFPRNFILLYLAVTLIMFTVSPWEWPLDNAGKFYTYNILILCFFYLGYQFGAHKYKPCRRTSNAKVHLLINCSLLVNVAFLYPKLLFRLHVPSISMSTFLDRVELGLSSPATVYALKHQSDFTGFLTLSNPLTMSYTLLLPLLYILIPACLFYWDSLKRYQKIGFWLILVADISAYIAIGTNKGIFDIVLIAPWILFSKNPSKILSFRLSTRKIRLYFLALLMLIAGVTFFAKGNLERKGERFYFEPGTQTHANLDSAVLVFVPYQFVDAYLSLDSYLTSGYYAMALALETDFDSTYGFGHSFFLTSLGEKLLGAGSISDRTYQAKLDRDHGWSQYGKWHTFYVSIANDVSFFGVLFVVFIIAYYFSQAWIDIAVFKNLFAVSVFSLFIIMLFYFPANNQVLGFQGQSISFWVLFAIWRIRRRGRTTLINQTRAANVKV